MRTTAPRPRRRAPLLGALLSLLVLACALAAPVQAAPSVGGVSARPDLPVGDGGAPASYFELELEPGSVYRGAVIVTNTGQRRVRLVVDGVDGLTGATSGAVYAARDRKATEAGTWVTPGRDVLHVAGSTKRRVPFTVRVPQDARPGDHLAGVVVQSERAPADGSQFAVTQLLRVVVAVQIRVPGPAEKRIVVGDLGLERVGGTQVPSVVSRLENTGQLLCEPELTTEIEQDGQRVGTLTRKLLNVLPGDAIDYAGPWPRPLSRGTYDVTVTARGCGPDSTKTQTVELDQDAAGTLTDPGTDFGAGAGPLTLPWWAALAAAFVALIAGLLLSRLGRRRRQPPAHGQQAPA